MTQVLYRASMREAMEECELTLDPTRLIQVERGGNIEVDQHRNGTEYTFVVNGSLYLMTPEEKEASTEYEENWKKHCRTPLEGNERDVALFSENTLILIYDQLHAQYYNYLLDWKIPYIQVKNLKHL